MRPGPLPAHGQPSDPELLALLAFAAGFGVVTALAMRLKLRPLPLHRRARAVLRHYLSR